MQDEAVINLVDIKLDQPRPRRSITSKNILAAKTLKCEKPEKLKLRKKHKRKRLECLECNPRKTFATKKQLQSHVEKAHKTVNLEVGIICQICFKSLRSENYYKRHLATRHPETPKIFICDFDGQSFRSKDYIRIHMDRHRQHQILTCATCQKSYVSRHTFMR